MRHSQQEEKMQLLTWQLMSLNFEVLSFLGLEIPARTLRRNLMHAGETLGRTPALATACMHTVTRSNSGVALSKTYPGPPKPRQARRA